MKRLEDSASHLRKGDAVLAVFADTTSFYRAIVAKNPKAPAHVNSSWDVVVRFEDDEDENGISQHGGSSGAIAKSQNAENIGDNPGENVRKDLHKNEMPELEKTAEVVSLDTFRKRPTN